MYLTTGGGAIASRGQKFKNYTKELKLEIVKLRLQETSLPKYQITDSMIISWGKKYQTNSEVNPTKWSKTKAMQSKNNTNNVYNLMN